MYEEIKSAIDEVMENIDETEEFKRGFKGLIENFMENSFREDDIKEVINLVKLKGEENIES